MKFLALRNAQTKEGLFHTLTADRLICFQQRMEASAFHLNQICLSSRNNGMQKFQYSFVMYRQTKYS